MLVWITVVEDNKKVKRTGKQLISDFGAKRRLAEKKLNVNLADHLQNVTHICAFKWLFG